MEEMELICFNIISCVGAARSTFIEAVKVAKTGDIEKARELITEGEKLFTEGHHSHSKLITEEAAGNKTEFSLILMHAEDQLMSAEAFKIIAEELIDVYERINK